MVQTNRSQVLSTPLEEKQPCHLVLIDGYEGDEVTMVQMRSTCSKDVADGPGALDWHLMVNSGGKS